MSGNLGSERRPRRERALADTTEDRQRDRTEGAKAACKRHGYLEGGQVARARDGHGAAHLKGACLKEVNPFFVFTSEPLGGPPGGGLFNFKLSSWPHP